MLCHNILHNNIFIKELVLARKKLNELIKLEHTKAGIHSLNTPTPPPKKKIPDIWKWKIHDPSIYLIAKSLPIPAAHQ